MEPVMNLGITVAAPDSLPVELTVHVLDIIDVNLKRKWQPPHIREQRRQGLPAGVTNRGGQIVVDEDEYADPLNWRHQATFDLHHDHDMLALYYTQDYYFITLTFTLADRDYNTMETLLQQAQTDEQRREARRKALPLCIRYGTLVTPGVRIISTGSITTTDT